MDAAQDRPRAWTDLSALMALCAGLRLAFVWLVPRTLDSADAVAYLETARLLARGDLAAIDPKIPVLYPAAVALAHQLIPDVESAGRAASWIFSTLLVVPVYLLARALHGRAVARIAGVLVAFWPWLIDYGSRVATEPLAVFLFLSGVCALTIGLRRDAGVGTFAIAGACFGLLHLARAEGTFVYLAAPLALLVVGPSRISRPAPKLAAYAVPGVVALATGAFVTYATAEVVTLNYRVGFIGDQPEGSTVVREFARTLIAMTADVPAVMLGPLLWAFFGIGVAAAGAAPRDARAELGVLYFAVLQWFIVLPVLSPAPRYLMAAFVICSVWSARGVERSMALARRGAPRWTYAPLAVVVLWMMFHAAAQVASERLGEDDARPRQPWEYKAAGEWMRDHLDAGTIVTRKPQIGFYAEMPTAGVPADATVADVIAGAAKNGYRYLAVDERYTVELVPAFKPLLDPGAAPDGLRLLTDSASPYAGARVVVYEFAAGSERER